MNDSGLVLTGSFDNEPLEYVLNTLELTLDLQAVTTEDGIILTPGQ
jgi:hypothetical protein